ncbi:hypothetical protein GH714_008590 [Hevea brasiliensis]|uniref:acetyl-CoA carboxytransferase n=1 Tax=Hevea brasiliensis TaxID=3981 RepID=A0A6A6KI35_HEVBR|nr:hypothetical protein GH714_008590 [Hevea brasiliensis]
MKNCIAGLGSKGFVYTFDPIQRVNIARHPNRPTFLDHVFSITDKFVELHGDRAGYDDPAIVTGIGTIDGRRYMFMGHQKGRNTKENIMRNFGMPTPHGYRKALRMMYYADHHGFPIVTFIDTPGAYADLKSEELGQGEAIAHNLRTMFGLKAAEKLKITATELCKLQIADGVIPTITRGTTWGAHADPSWTSQQIKNAINELWTDPVFLQELQKMDTQELLKHRMLKFRKIGGFQEGIPIDPKRKINMKKKEEPVAGKTPVLELEAVKAMGYKDRFEILRKEILKENSQDQLMHPVLMDKIEKLKNEFTRNLSAAPNFGSLKYKLDMLKEFSKAKNISEKNSKSVTLKQDINKKLKEVMDRPDMKEKIEALKAEVQMVGASNEGKLDEEAKERIVTMRKEIRWNWQMFLSPWVWMLRL